MSCGTQTMTLPLHLDAAGEFTPQASAEVLEAAQGADAVALGPGLGRELCDLLRQ